MCTMSSYRIASLLAAAFLTVNIIGQAADCSVALAGRTRTNGSPDRAR
jgi:hypothetical protein